MKIGILVSMINNFGKKGFYNSQEIGMAKALSNLNHQVTIYKLIGFGEDLPSDFSEDNYAVKYSFVKNIGINGLVNTSVLDSSLDALVFFADTQLSVPKVYKWCKQNIVKFIPYIGVTESHSNSKITRFVINTLFNRNLRVYKKSECLVKTPAVEVALRKLGVGTIKVAPVGLDLTLLNSEFQSANPLQLKEKYGYSSEDKVLLFIGRLVPEKQPEKMLEIFSKLYEKDSSYKLIMVGKGELKEKIVTLVQEKGIAKNIQFFESIKNSDIWELYRFADAFINLNEQEIFGMVILEAMFYGCKVVALHAPGPDFIIENGVSGVLCYNEQEIINAILDNTDYSSESHNRILNEFTWDNTASVINSLL